MLIAFDPGRNGAVAHLHHDGRFCCVESMPDSPAGLALLVRDLQQASPEPTTAIVERVGAMPGQGTVSMFTFGRGLGWIEGVLAAARVPSEMVSPHVWKRDMGIGKDKEKARQAALALFPDAAEDLKRKKDEGRAEALLLGLWFARKLGREPVTAADPDTPETSPAG